MEYTFSYKKKGGNSYETYSESIKKRNFRSRMQWRLLSRAVISKIKKDQSAGKREFTRFFILNLKI